ncbi:putative membrane protein [Wickerhamomyces ciferrii]|uniref:Membrane protein n=1 Tax=Wickerhamomyces ciferrii (strain ATCC 14091 / BCRC 22168 / CBS 111 / JCM 3599 / NBRC 0793 / NRRL Y-1031 F-60-10) TaxID=1206466 RepID=K0KY27_WICCF|nr:uncharacterized protein BN7_5590 [Wickerhamomyces ciferrii]CCH46003.1 putative membrane protein [Wickerhamomyces ciferrii]
MLIQRVVRPLTSISVKGRWYSTISTQSTVSNGSNPILNEILPPIHENSTPIKHEQISNPISITDKISNLNKAKELFQDIDGVFSKIDLLQNLNSSKPIRIGLVNPKKSFLNTILSDPFASDQSWYNQFQERSDSQLIKYNDEFQNLESQLEIPSPFLQNKNLEFLEILNLEHHNFNDGCHLYLNFNPGLINNYKYPTWEIKDSTTDLLYPNELNSNKALEATNLLTKSSLNASEYTKLYNESQFPEFLKTLDKLIEPKQIEKTLYQSILKNFQIQLNQKSLTFKELSEKDIKIQTLIKNWDESTHREFQLNFKPYITNFEKKNLDWWKLYYKNDDIETILTNMLNQNFLPNSIQQISYIQGQIDSFNSQTTSDLNDNPLISIKQDIINNELIPIQNQVTRLLGFNFIGLQLPVGLVAISGWFWFGFEPYSMISLGSLGLVLGFNNISKKWLNIITNFKSQLFEKIRIAIGETNLKLYKNWELKYNFEKGKIEERIKLLKTLQE